MNAFRTAIDVAFEAFLAEDNHLILLGLDSLEWVWGSLWAFVGGYMVPDDTVETIFPIVC